MSLSMKRIVQALMSAEFSDGLGVIASNGEVISLESPKDLRSVLHKAKAFIEFMPCSDVARLKVNEIDHKLKSSPRREIMRACQQLLTMKAPHGQRKWGIGITPTIQDMLTNKVHQLIDCMYENAEKVSQYHQQCRFVELDFSRYVGHLVSVAIQLLPSSKNELLRFYHEIWFKRERDRAFPANKTQKQRETMHNECLQLINNLQFDSLGLPMASLSFLEPSGFAEIQKLHWKSSLLRSAKITSQNQQAAFRAFINLKKMADGRNDDESKRLNEIIQTIIEDVEITHYWLSLLNNEFDTYQQLTCHDWGRLDGVSTKKVNALVQELTVYMQDSQEVHLRIAFLRLLLPLVEPWVLCILLERKLKKESISRHISTGLKELMQHIESVRPELLDTFNQLKQFARPYGKGKIQ